MIRGILREELGRRRPFVTGLLEISAAQVAGDVAFLIDTGADSTVLAPRDTIRLGLDLQQLPQGSPSTGIGGRTATAYADAILTLDGRQHEVRLRILAPGTQEQQRALARIPSLLGRDMLSHFALFYEERTGKVLLLEPREADALGLS
jgi:predicted aspartyl protease